MPLAALPTFLNLSEGLARSDRRKIAVRRIATRQDVLTGAVLGVPGGAASGSLAYLARSGDDYSLAAAGAGGAVTASALDASSSVNIGTDHSEADLSVCGC